MLVTDAGDLKRADLREAGVLEKTLRQPSRVRLDTPIRSPLDEVVIRASDMRPGKGWLSMLIGRMPLRAS